MSMSYCLQWNNLLMIDEVNNVCVILFTVNDLLMIDEVNNVCVILFTVERPVDDR